MRLKGERVKELVTIVFLAVNGWTDLKKRQISLMATGIYGAAGLVWRLYTGGNPADFLVPAGIGGLMIIMGLLTKGAVGAGDGLLVMAAGMVLNPDDLALMLMVGLFACAIWSGILLVVFHRGRKTEIPFVPFLLLGYVGGVLIWR